jgi:predicted O-linked N-acetylglucosamine transferase (SPINDLY family)
MGYDMNGRKRKRKYLKKTRKATIRNFEPVKVKENPVLTQADEHRQKYPQLRGFRVDFISTNLRSHATGLFL